MRKLLTLLLALALTCSDVAYAGGAGQCSTAGGGLCGSSATIDGKTIGLLGSNEVNVFTAADLPAASGGTITLEANTTYFIREVITLSDDLFIPAGAEVQITSLSRGPALVYTGTGTFIDSASGSFIGFRLVQLTLSSANATLFSVTAGQVLIISVGMNFNAAGQSIGSVTTTGDAGFLIEDSLIVGFDTGLTVGGSQFFTLEKTGMFAAAGTGTILDFAPTLSDILMTNCAIGGFVGFTGDLFDIDSGYTGNAIFTAVANIGGDFFAPPPSLDHTSKFVLVGGSPPQTSSKNIGSVIANGNATDTVINTQGVFVDINLGGNAVLGSNSQLWTLTGTSTGELTYGGLSEFNGALSCAFSASSSGGSQEFAFRAVMNGLVLPDPVVQLVELGNDTGAVGLIVPIMADPGATIRGQVANLDGTSNVLVKNLSCEVK